MTDKSRHRYSKTCPMLGRPVQPITGCILVYLHNVGGAPQRIAFGQCSDHRLEDHRSRIQIPVGPPVPHRHTLSTSDTTPVSAYDWIHLDQPALTKGNPINSTGTIRTIKSLP